MPTPVGGVNAGLDAGLKNAWNVRSGLGYTRRGVVIGIVDDGVGSAPYAGIAGMRIRLGDSYTGDPAVTEQDYYDVHLWQSGLNPSTLAIEAAPQIHVKNHSYGPTTPFEEYPDRLKDILRAAAGNGIVSVYAAGNARNKDPKTKEVSCEDSNKDFTLTSPYVLTVAAMGSDGRFEKLQPQLRLRADSARQIRRQDRRSGVHHGGEGRRYRRDGRQQVHSRQ